MRPGPVASIFACTAAAETTQPQQQQQQQQQELVQQQQQQNVFVWDIFRRLYTASADETLAIWDMEAGERIKILRGHLSVVNSVSVFGARTVSPVPVYGHAAAAAAAAGAAPPTAAAAAAAAPAILDGSTAAADSSSSKSYLFSTGSSSYSTKFLLASGGDDGTTRILAVALDGVGCRVFAGSLDNTIREYDMRAGLRESGALEGHQDSVTGLDIHPNGSHLLSNAMDHTVRLWDVQPFLAGQKRQQAIMRGAMVGCDDAAFVAAVAAVAAADLCLLLLLSLDLVCCDDFLSSGQQQQPAAASFAPNNTTHNFEKQLLRVHWSCDGCYAVAGSSDRNVCIWDVETVPSKDRGGEYTRSLIYRLPGHTGSVNDPSLQGPQTSGLEQQPQRLQQQLEHQPWQQQRLQQLQQLQKHLQQQQLQQHLQRRLQQLQQQLQDDKGFCFAWQQQQHSH
ncbi:hypothetical protein ACSSS7_007033 [Eimeria intestinalis]